MWLKIIVRFDLDRFFEPDGPDEIAFTVTGGRGKGTCIWEPLNSWESIFDKEGNSNPYLMIYDSMSNRFVRPQSGVNLTAAGTNSR